MNVSQSNKMSLLIVIGILAYTSVLIAQVGRESPAKPKDVSMTGTITDLHSYATGESQPARAVQRLIRVGMPAVLETKEGPVLLGSTSRQFQKELMRLVHENVMVEGRLYQKQGLRYLDITALDFWDPQEERPARAVEPGQEPELESEQEAVEAESEVPPPDEPEPEPVP